MRRLLAVSGALALPVAAVGATTTLLSRRVLRVRSEPPYRHDLLAVGRDALLFRRDHATELPGTYGLAWPGGHAVVGPVLHADSATVLRRLERTQLGTPQPGRCALDHIEIGDPASAVGLTYENVALESDAGTLPGWWVPGARRDAWVLFAHGYGGSLVSSLSFLPIAARPGYNALAVSYRNDPDAPASADRRYHLGVDEWRDLDAGISFALDHGAERIVLYGWSMGGGIALRALAESAQRDAIAALVLDAPVLDWEAVIRHVGRRVPAPLLGLIVGRLQRHIGAPLSALNHLSRAAELDRPVLCFHGERDELVPVAHSRLLAERAPTAVELVVDDRAGHVGCFNVDPIGYEARIQDFLQRVFA